MSSIDEAVRRGNTTTLRTLLNEKANPNNVVADHTLLMSAVTWNQCAVVTVLLEFKADPNYLNASNQTVLTSAVYSPDTSILQVLLASKANPNVVDKKGLTPLGYTIMEDDHERSVMLLNAHADPNVRVLRSSPLEIASSMLNMETVRALLSWRASPDTPMLPVIKKLVNPTPALSASDFDVELCRLLIAHGADVTSFKAQMKGSLVTDRMYLQAALGDIIGVPRMDALSLQPHLTSLQSICIQVLSRTSDCHSVLKTLEQRIGATNTA